MLGDYTAGRYYTNLALEHPSRQAPHLNLTLTHVSDDDKTPHSPHLHLFTIYKPEMEVLLCRNGRHQQTKKKREP